MVRWSYGSGLLLALSLGANACPPRARSPEVRPLASVPPEAVSAPSATAKRGPAASAPSELESRTKLELRKYQARDANVVSACSDFAYAYCRRDEQCTLVDFKLRFGNRVHCVEQTTVWCAREFEAQDSGFTRESLAACRSAMRDRACRRWRRLEDLPIEACHPKGSRQLDDACFSGAQCISGFCAKPRLLEGSNEGVEAPCGKCAPVVTLGDRCAGPSAQFFGCPVGTACSRGMCIGPFADEGEACAAGAWYQTCYGTFPQDATPTNLACDFQRSKTPVCRRPPEPTHCEREGDCWEGRYCEPARKVCVPKRFAEPGEPCTNESVACKAGAVCRDTCVAPAKPGEACDVDHACEWPANCVDGACILLDSDVCSDSAAR